MCQLHFVKAPTIILDMLHVSATILIPKPLIGHFKVGDFICYESDEYCGDDIDGYFLYVQVVNIENIRDTREPNCEYLRSWLEVEPIHTLADVVIF